MWSWQITVVAVVSQCPQFQCLTENVSLIAPVKRVEIRTLLDWFPEIHLRLSMHYYPNGAFPSESSILP